MREDRLFIACGQLAVRADRRASFLFPVAGDLEVPGSTIAWFKGTNTSRRRVGIPTWTGPNDGRSVLVST
jgi:hypothetical protein